MLLCLKSLAQEYYSKGFRSKPGMKTFDLIRTLNHFCSHLGRPLDVFQLPSDKLRKLQAGHVRVWAGNRWVRSSAAPEDMLAGPGSNNNVSVEMELPQVYFNMLQKGNLTAIHQLFICWDQAGACSCVRCSLLFAMSKLQQMQ